MAVGALLTAGIAVAMAGSPPVDRAAVPRADLDIPRGVHPALREDDETVRVRILLRSQPVLHEVQSARFQRSIEMRSVARARRLAHRSPEQLSVAERRLVLRAEQRYETAVASLQDEVARSREQQIALESVVVRAGGRVSDVESAPSSIVARVPSSDLESLAKRRAVQAITPEPKLSPQLDVARSVVGAPVWWTANHTGGEGSADRVLGDVGTDAEGPDPSHPAFASLTIDNSPMVVADDDHATHVAGVIASGDPTYTGVAFGIDKLIGGLSDAYLVGVGGFEGPGAADPAETINESFGAVPATDDDDNSDDMVAHLFGVGYASAAGNHGPSSGTASGIGRNVLSVGAYDDRNTVSTADDLVATFSSRGPTPGGRKKPDLLAPGIGIVAPDAQWEGANPDFTSVQGTSFSAPFVAGGMALLEGAGITDARVQRAILVNSARPWAGQTSWQPDVGWGALDLTTAFAQRANFQIGSVEGGGARFFRANQATGARATLVWDRRGVWGSFPDCCLTAYTTTNLDLRQYVESTLAEVPPPGDPGHGGGPDAVDPNDTTEQVRAPAGGPQEVVYKVEANSTVEGAAAEQFAIAAAAPLTPLANPEVDPVNLAAPSGPVNCVTDLTISTQLENDSPDLDAHDAEVTLTLPAGVALVSGPITQEVSGGTLERSTSGSETRTWVVRATSSGVKQLTITGQGQTMGESFVSSDQVSFTADCSPPTVAPSGTTVSPPGPVGCESDQVISTTLRNDSITDAQSAEVHLDLPFGASLISGAATQQVSGGVLEAGMISEAHSWTVRATQPGLSATITGSASQGAQRLSYPESISLACTGGSERDPTAVTLEIVRAKIKRGRLVVKGTAASSAGPPPGRISVEVGNDRRKEATAALRGGRFKLKLRVCEPGRWRVEASYSGGAGFAAAEAAAQMVRVRKRQVRC
jgi:serine protease AprX